MAAEGHAPTVAQFKRGRRKLLQSYMDHHCMRGRWHIRDMEVRECHLGQQRATGAGGQPQHDVWPRVRAAQASPISPSKLQPTPLFDVRRQQAGGAIRALVRGA